MRSFHNNQEIKDKYLARLRKHAELDNIIQGICWENGKGCAVGCTLEDYDHEAYEAELGIPEWLAQLEDILFEGMTSKDAKDFPILFLESIPLNKTIEDFEDIKFEFLEFILDENIKKVKAIDTKESYKQELLDAQELCRKYYHSRSEEDREVAWSAAESAGVAAESAAESVAWSSAAESAAWSTWSAAASVESIAESAARAAWSAAASVESVAYKRYADKLIELLKG